MPPFVLSSPSTRRMTTLSCNGRNFIRFAFIPSAQPAHERLPWLSAAVRHQPNMAFVGTRYKGVLTIESPEHLRPGHGDLRTYRARHASNSRSRRGEDERSRCLPTVWPPC